MGGERKGEKHQCMLHLVLPYWGPGLYVTQACALDWESNRQPFVSQTCTQSTELHQPGQDSWVLKEQNYFTFNAFVSHRLKEEKAKFIRAKVDGLYMFGWIVLQMLSTYLVVWCFLRFVGAGSYSSLFSYLQFCNLSGSEIKRFFLFYLVAWTDLSWHDTLLLYLPHLVWIIHTFHCRNTNVWLSRPPWEC